MCSVVRFSCGEEFCSLNAPRILEKENEKGQYLVTKISHINIVLSSIRTFNWELRRILQSVYSVLVLLHMFCVFFLVWFDHADNY